jgi:hypothetical protein
MARRGGRIGRAGGALLALALLAGCDPAALTRAALARTAETVVRPVVAVDLPAPVAAAATACIVAQASEGELQALARDVGVSAGTTTRANIRAIALRPATQACFAARGVPPVTGG